MTRPRRSALFALIVPVAVAGLTTSSRSDAYDSSHAGVSAAPTGTWCVGVDYAGIQVSRCVPVPDGPG